MKMKKWVWVFLCLFLVACGSESEKEREATIGKHGRIAEEHLEKKGYQVISYNGEFIKTLKKADLLEEHEKNMWAVQSVSPDAYIGKTIYFEHFTVKNHPIDAQSDFGQAAVTVMVVDGKVIGGKSFPDSDGSYMGNGYSLNGKTMEDMHPDIQEWKDAWEEKYSE